MQSASVRKTCSPWDQVTACIEQPRTGVFHEPTQTLIVLSRPSPSQGWRSGPVIGSKPELVSMRVPLQRNEARNAFREVSREYRSPLVNFVVPELIELVLDYASAHELDTKACTYTRILSQPLLHSVSADHCAFYASDRCAASDATSMRLALGASKYARSIRIHADPTRPDAPLGQVDSESCTHRFFGKYENMSECGHSDHVDWPMSDAPPAGVVAARKTLLHSVERVETDAAGTLYLSGRTEVKPTEARCQVWYSRDVLAGFDRWAPEAASRPITDLMGCDLVRYAPAWNLVFRLWKTGSRFCLSASVGGDAARALALAHEPAQWIALTNFSPSCDAVAVTDMAIASKGNVYFVAVAGDVARLYILPAPPALARMRGCLPSSRQWRACYDGSMSVKEIRAPCVGGALGVPAALRYSLVVAPHSDRIFFLDSQLNQIWALSTTADVEDLIVVIPPLSSGATTQSSQSPAHVAASLLLLRKKRKHVEGTSNVAFASAAVSLAAASVDPTPSADAPSPKSPTSVVGVEEPPIKTRRRHCAAKIGALDQSASLTEKKE